MMRRIRWRLQQSHPSCRLGLGRAEEAGAMREKVIVDNLAARDDGFPQKAVEH